MPSKTTRRQVMIGTGAAVLAAATSSIEAMAQTAGNPMTTPTGLQITDTKVGTGDMPKPGQTCVMHYTGWLLATGTKFDSSVDRGKAFIPFVSAPER